MTPEILAPLIATILDRISPRALFQKSVAFSGDEVSVGGLGFDLSKYGAIQVVGLGKAAVPQTEALLAMMGEAGTPSAARLRRPLALTKYGHGTGGSGIDVREAGHPVCDERSAASGRALTEAARSLAPGDLFVLLLSGGASTLAVSPLPPFTLEDKLRTFDELMRRGAPIREMNAIRREMSEIKNGGLASLCGAGTILALITADVPDGDLASVGSGPTYLTADAPAQLVETARRNLEGPALAKLEAHSGSEARAAEIRRREASLKGKLIVNHGVAGASTLREAAASALSSRFGRVEATEPFALEMGVDEGVEIHVNQLREMVRSKAGAVLMSGGELGVGVRGRGRGGRNTEFALRAAKAVFEENRIGLREGDLSRVAVAAIGTDGTDGPTDFAGAWIDLAGYREARRLGLRIDEFLAASDSLEYFRAIDRLIRTGPTGTNLMDLRMVFVESS